MRSALRLTRFPRVATEADYEQATAELEGRLAELPGIVAVYRTGSVSVLGISDIDRIAVVEPGATPPDVWSSLSEDTRSLAMHGPFLVDTETFPRVRWLADLEPLELVSGEEIPLQERPEPEYLDLLIATESLVVLTLKLLKQAASGRVKVRPTLCELHNLRHDLRLAGIAHSDAPEAWALTERVASLRSSWWSLRDGERRAMFLSLFADSWRAASESFQAVSQGHPNGRGRVSRLPLSAAWDNVVLVPRSVPDSWPAGRLSGVVARSARAAEALWRARRHELGVPAPVLSLILDEQAEMRALRDERRRIVRRYRDFLGRTRGYSGIGLAAVFEP
jgi:hypothetical protein